MVLTQHPTGPDATPGPLRAGDTADFAATDPGVLSALGDWLRGGRPGEWILTRDAARVLQAIDAHGLSCLLHVPADEPGPVADALRGGLKRRRLARALWEEHHRRIVVRAIAALDDAGLEPIVLKGSALAWSIYPEPAARIRGDSDLLIPEQGRGAAEGAMRTAGFTQIVSAAGNVMGNEQSFVARDPQGVIHTVDLHWRISASIPLAREFPYERLRSRAAELALPERRVLRTGNVDSLLIACFHRRVHLTERVVYVNDQALDCPERLIWLADVDLLVRHMSSSDWADFLDGARAGGLADSCRAALAAAQGALGTPVPDDARAALAAAGAGRIDRYLSGSRLVQRLWDLASVRGLGRRAAMVRDLFFPPAEYMRAAYGRGWLPRLYARRAVTGAAKWLGSGGRG